MWVSSGDVMISALNDIIHYIKHETSKQNGIIIKLFMQIINYFVEMECRDESKN